MQNVARQQEISALRASIAGIEKRPLLADRVEPAGKADKAARPADTVWETLFAAPAGLLHEIFATSPRDTGAALGFALGLARELVSPARPAMLFLQLTHEAQDTGPALCAGFRRFRHRSGCG